jgi:hypothetical protein
MLRELNGVCCENRMERTGLHTGCAECVQTHLRTECAQAHLRTGCAKGAQTHLRTECAECVQTLAHGGCQVCPHRLAHGVCQVCPQTLAHGVCRECPDTQMSRKLALPFNLIAWYVPLVLKYEFGLTHYLVADKNYSWLRLYPCLSTQQKMYFVTRFKFVFLNGV